MGFKLIFFKKIKILGANYIVTYDIFNRLSQSLSVTDHSDTGPLKRVIFN